MRRKSGYVSHNVSQTSLLCLYQFVDCSVKFFLLLFFYREKLRHEKILCSLAGNITTSHTIYPSFGTAEFFEFVLRNPYSTEQTITIHCDDNELKYVEKIFCLKRQSFDPLDFQEQGLQ